MTIVSGWPTMPMKVWRIRSSLLHNGSRARINGPMITWQGKLTIIQRLLGGSINMNSRSCSISLTLKVALKDNYRLSGLTILLVVIMKWTIFKLALEVFGKFNLISTCWWQAPIKISWKRQIRMESSTITSSWMQLQAMIRLPSDRQSLSSMFFPITFPTMIRSFNSFFRDKSQSSIPSDMRKEKHLRLQYTMYKIHLKRLLLDRPGNAAVTKQISFSQPGTAI